MKREALLTKEWNQVLHSLEEVLPSNFLNLWLKQLRPITLKENDVVISCPNQFVKQWVQERFIHYLKSAWIKIRPNLGEIILEIQTHNAKKPRKVPKLVHQPLALKAFRPQLCPQFTFEEFVVGKSNAYAYDASKHLAIGDLRQPLYLYSDTGLGKSHLSQAIGHFLLKTNEPLKVFYITTEEFTNQMVKAIKNNYIRDFKNKYRYECDVLILENLHFLSGKEKIQLELAYTLDALLESQRRVVFTSLTPPQKIPGLKKEFRSRIATGVFAPINPPDKETRFHILLKKSQKESVKIPKQVIERLASKIEGDVRKLESALKNVVARAVVQKRPVDVDLAEEVISFFIENTPSLDIEFIKNLVCQHYGISPEKLISKSRKREIAQPRKVAIYLAKHILNLPLTEIGRHFQRHHATIISILNSTQKEINRRGPLSKEIAYLENKIRQSQGY